MMANTYVLLASSTVGSGGAADITFSSIPATYTDLILLLSIRTDRAGTIGDNLSLSYNGSTSSQSDTRLYADGSGAYSYTDTALYAGIATAASATASTFGNTMVYIPNYAGSNNKSSSSDGVAENNGSSTAMNLGAELWSNSAAITSVKISSRYSATLQQYSTAYLYGVKSS
jgi:hypothetical protein